MRLSLRSPDDLARALGTRVKALRLMRNVTQIDLAGRAGISPASLKRLENGGTGSVETVARLALILGAETEFEALFAMPEPATLDAVIDPPARRHATGKRGA